MIGATEFFVFLAGSSPALALWIAVIVFAAIMLRRGGGRAERFLVAGASLKIISILTCPLTVFIVPWLVGRGYGTDSAISLASGYGIVLNIVGMAGIICLVYAFWIKFKARNLERLVSLTQN